MAPSIKINKLYAAGFFTLLHQQGQRVGKWRNPNGSMKVWWNDGTDTFFDNFAIHLWDEFKIPIDNWVELYPNSSDKLLERMSNNFFNQQQS